LGFYFLLLSGKNFCLHTLQKNFLARLKKVALYLYRRQCFGSGIRLGLGPDSVSSVDPYPDPDSVSGKPESLGIGKLQFL
jgi:hypothetical protein